VDHEGLTDQRGAEVIGLDFALPGDRETRDTLNRSFMDHHIGPPHWTTTLDHHMLIMLDLHLNERCYLYRRMLKGEVPA